ncbi:cytochrome c oxidase assembly protein [Alcanivorax sp. JB21]|uniref:cytochrome c oxidase assembly protein n=1 Tax=Alcanivorax limicola TaxID=2874102 RepID=UPI001CC1983B|nr:cytochrome c oxidase assembly protein [Alcanivorax limicola]MBZ2188606.1 cytochrome c oxidase assembly protein [Alcanivorax limicola]
MADEPLKRRTRLSVAKLLVVCVCMFGFAYALVPLYDVICEALGINGRTNSVAIVDVPEDMTKDEDRTVLVQFVTRAAKDMPWDFEPMERSVRVHPGEIKAVNFRVRNRTGEDMVGQAIPSLVPGQAASHFKKTQCFCFDQQPLMANGEEVMPMIFYLDPAIPKSVNTITLSYTLYDITERTSVGGVAARQTR